MVAQNINVAGVAQIQIGSGLSEALEVLGWTVSMAEISHQAFYHDVFGDQHGGPQGPPIDIQFLGEIATIRLELSRYDTVVFDKLRQRLNPRDAADTAHKNLAIAAAVPGSLMFQGGSFYRVLINTPAGNSAAGIDGPTNFPRCILRNAIDMSKGTKFTSAIVEFEAHRDQNSPFHLWNDTTA